jgi:MFS family permease
MTLHAARRAVKMVLPMSDTSIKPDPYATWRIRDFRWYALSFFALMFSKQVETLALAVYFVSIYSRSDAPLALGIMGLVQALPVMLLAIAAGQLADRFDRRGMVLLTLGIVLLAAVGLLAAVVYEWSIFWIFLMLGVGAVGQALGSPARSALLPQLVPAQIFPNAIAWHVSVFQISAVTGPVAAGAIMALSQNPATPLVENPAPALVVVLVCRVVAVAAMALVRRPQANHAQQAVSWKSVAAGIKFVWRTKLILATITLDLFAVLLGGAVYLLPIFAKDILHVGTTGLGFLRAAEAVGAICMAVALTHLPPMPRAGVTMLWAVAGFGVATIIFGLSQWFWLSLAMMFLVGALDNISVVVRHTLVQMLTPDEMRGRVSAVNNVFIVASNDLGGLESGLTAWLFTPVISVVGGGVGTILAVLAAVKLWPEVLRIGSLAAIRPVAAEEPDQANETAVEQAANRS